MCLGLSTIFRGYQFLLIPFHTVSVDLSPFLRTRPCHFLLDGGCCSGPEFLLPRAVMAHSPLGWCEHRKGTAFS